MKRIFLFFTLMFFSLSNGQELDSLKRVWFMVQIDSIKKDQPLATKFDNCVFSNSKKPEKGKIESGVFYLEDYILCIEGGIRKFIYKINNGVQTYFVNTDDVSFVSKEKDGDQSMVFLSTLQPQEKILYKTALEEFIQRLEEYRNDLKIKKEERPIRESILNIFKNPLVIYDYSFTNNYSIGFRIEILNTSKKRIKYINFNVSGFNEVDDRVRTFGGEYSRVLRGVGPIEVDGGGS